MGPFLPLLRRTHNTQILWCGKVHSGHTLALGSPPIPTPVPIACPIPPSPQHPIYPYHCPPQRPYTSNLAPALAPTPPVLSSPRLEVRVPRYSPQGGGNTGAGSPNIGG